MTDSTGEFLHLDVHGARMARSAGSAARAVAEDVGFTAVDADRASALVTKMCHEVCHTDFDDPDDARFEVTIAEAPAALTFTIADRGLPFSLTGERASTVVAGILQAGDADRVAVGSDGDQNTITVAIRRDPATQGHLIDYDTPTDEVTDPTAPHVERLGPEHLESLARCTWRVYGHTYVADFLYHPAETWKLVEQGRLHSVVALDGDGEVIGHVGLELGHPSDLVGDATLALTDPLPPPPRVEVRGRRTARHHR